MSSFIVIEDYMVYSFSTCVVSVLGEKLIFVLKLDECQIVKGRRLERMSVTLMNEAMFLAKIDAIGDHSQRPSFSVQSEKEIWWLRAFEVPKETHEVLAWVFSMIPWITETIQAQLEGEQLEVDGLGTFNVEWHLGGDLKTIKCILGCKQGASSLLPCPYCMRGYKESTRGSKSSKKSVQRRQETRSMIDDDTREWECSVLKCPIMEVPNRSTKDRAWHPIINFPLTNVHFCTLHAFMRIFDRLLKLHIEYAFTMKPLSRSVEAIGTIEGILNSIGCHGGNVSIMGEVENMHEVPQKVSMNGVKARRFLKKPEMRKEKGEDGASWELWKALCQCTTDKDSNPVLVNTRKQVWHHFEQVVQFMWKPQTTSEQQNLFKTQVSNFTKAFVQAWGESNITHYMVNILLNSSFNAMYT